MKRKKETNGICYKCRINKPLPLYNCAFLSNSLRNKCRDCLKGRKYGRKLIRFIRSTDLENITEENQKLIEKYSGETYQLRETKQVPKTEHLMKNYGISVFQYMKMYEDQSGVCVICKRHEDKLVVDHDHKTKKVRALLCSSCNSGLGLFGDNPDIMRKAANYVTHHRLSIKPHSTVELTQIKELAAEQKKDLYDNKLRFIR